MGKNRYAIFDLGSNAIRMVVAEVDFPNSKYQIIEKIRMPIRLGADVFDKGRLSDKTIQASCKTLTHLLELAQDFEAESTLAVGTAALRTAENSRDFVSAVTKSGGPAIKVISGKKEAELLFRAISPLYDFKKNVGISMDIGGGSTEINIIVDQHVISSRSFSIGTVKLRMESAKEQQTSLRRFSESAMRMIDRSGFVFGGKKNILFVGTGGNMRRMGKMRPHFFKNASTDHIDFAQLKGIRIAIDKMTLEELVSYYSLKKDRAEVIRPAMDITLEIFKHLPCQRIELPSVGLIDGLIREEILLKRGK